MKWTKTYKISSGFSEDHMLAHNFKNINGSLNFLKEFGRNLTFHGSTRLLEGVREEATVEDFASLKGL